MADIAELGLKVTGTTEIDQATLALDRLANAAGRSESAAMAAKRAHDEQTRATRQSAAATTNLAAQFQDIVVSLQGGQMPMTVALQQGSQIAPIFQQGATAVQLLRGAFLGLAQSLPIIAAIAAAGYAFQWLTSAGDKAKKLNELLADQAEVLKSLGNAYDGAASKADKLFDRATPAGFGIGAKSSQRDLQFAINRELDTAFETGDLGSRILAGKGTGGQGLGGMFQVSSEFKAFSDAITYLQATINKGKPDLLGFRNMVETRWALDPNNKELTRQAGILFDLFDKATKLTRAYEELRVAQENLAKTVDLRTGLPLRRGPMSTEDMSSFEQMQAKQRIDRERDLDQMKADYSRMFAKSPRQIADAVYRQEMAKMAGEDGMSPQEKRDKAEIASTMALAEAQYKLDEAYRQRARSLDATMETQRMQLELVGKTKGEQEALKMEMQLTQAAQEEAARNGVEVNQEWLKTIKEMSAEYGKLSEAIAKAQLDDQIMFERSQLFRSDGDQAIAGRLRGAGLAVDLNSPEALAMRWNRNFADLKDGIKGFFDDFGQGLLQGDSFGKALGQAILNALNKVLDRILDNLLNSITNDIASAIMGVPSMGDSGGGVSPGSWWTGAAKQGAGRFLGGAGSGAGNFASNAVDSMTTGSIGDWSKYITGMSGNSTRGGVPLATVMFGNLKTQVDASYADRFAKLSEFMSMHNYKVGSVGEGGYSYRNVAGTNNLSQHAFGRAVDINPRENPYSYSGRNNYNFDPHEAEKYSGLEYGGDWRKPDTMHWQIPRNLKGQEGGFNLDKLSKSAESSSKSISNLGDSTKDVSSDMTKLGKGFDDFGSKLSSVAMGGGGSGGGGAGFLGSLFKGGFGGTDLFGGGGGVTDLADWVSGGWHELHEGGLVGQPGGIRRMLHPSYLSVAPRLHKGLSPDEFPAILQKGERVVPRGQAQGSNGLVINMPIYNNSNAVVRREDRTNADGSREIMTFIDEANSSLLSRPGTLSNKAINQRWGRRPTLEQHA